jgi:hypothetical protein
MKERTDMTDRQQHFQSNEPPKFAGPTLSLPVMARMHDEHGERAMDDARGVMQNALDVLIERFSRYTEDAYRQGLAHGFMQGCLASDDAKARAREAMDNA